MRTTIPRITPRAMLIGSGCWGVAGRTGPTLGGMKEGGLVDSAGCYSVYMYETNIYVGRVLYYVRDSHSFCGTAGSNSAVLTQTKATLNMNWADKNNTAGVCVG